MRNQFAVGIILFTIMQLGEAASPTVFSDNSFDLADYTVETFQTGGAIIDTSQTLSDGNPGAALQSIIDIPAFSGTFYTRQYFMNSSFLYDPQTQGAIQSIDYTLDRYVEIQSLTLIGRSTEAIIFQDGNYYRFGKSTPAINAVWQTGSQDGLLATDFNLITDLLTRETDPTSHPDFAGSIIQFGTIIGIVSSGNPQHSFDIRVDNLSYTINPVSHSSVWDIDGNDEDDALTDGILIIRYLFGFRGDILISGAVDLENCTRCTAEEIETYIEENAH